MLSASQDRYSCFCYRSITQDLTDLPLVISFGEFRQILIGVNRKLPLLNPKSNIVLYAAKMHSLNIHIQMFGYMLQVLPVVVRVAGLGLGLPTLPRLNSDAF